jgi:hypothetical protein
MTLSICIEYHFAECHMLSVFTLSVVMLNVIMLTVFTLSVVMLNVIMLSVVAPPRQLSVDSPPHSQILD